MQDKRNIENVVKEIMELVDALSVECISFGIGQIECSKEDRLLLGEDVKKARSHLESKLRELVREQEEKIRVAVASCILASEIIDERSKERAHGITKDS